MDSLFIQLTFMSCTFLHICGSFTKSYLKKKSLQPNPHGAFTNHEKVLEHPKLSARQLFFVSPQSYLEEPQHAIGGGKKLEYPERSSQQKLSLQDTKNLQLVLIPHCSLIYFRGFINPINQS